MEMQKVNEIRELTGDELEAVSGGVVTAGAVAGAIAIGVGGAAAVVGVGVALGLGIYWLTS